MAASPTIRRRVPPLVAVAITAILALGACAERPVEPGTTSMDGLLLLTGDLGEDAQNALLAAGPLPRVDVVKVAHHGSRDQSPAFYAAAAAAYGVVSVGAGNDYGHPTRRLLGILGHPADR